MAKQVRNPNHPKKGCCLKVDPIREKWAIEAIKAALAPCPRNACLFTLGINTGLRANELLSLRVSQVRSLKVSEDLLLWQSKNDKYRRITLNESAVEAIALYLDSTLLDEDAYLFKSLRGEVLTVSSVCNLVKKWCVDVGLPGNYSSHTLRKTWAYWEYRGGASLPTLMRALGHTDQAVTLEYMCVQPQEIAELYRMVL